MDAMDIEDLARRIIVRYREDGHLRLELPAAICHPAAAAAIEQRLRGVAGVYRVGVQIRERRLVVRYETHACNAAAVARALKASLRELPAEDSAPASQPPVTDRLRPVFAQLRDGLDRLRQPNAAAGSLQARLQPVLASALTEKAITNFLNDLVAFYLIRVHWELISKRWLQEPLKHANAWGTVFYLVFLLVRYRKSMAKPKP